MVRASLVFFALAVVGCAPDAITPPPTAPAQAGPYTRDAAIDGAVRVAFTLHPAVDASFYDAPWPSELRRRDGRPDFTGFPGENTLIVDKYVAAAARDVDGFSIAPVIYFHFEAASGEPAVAPLGRADDGARRGRSAGAHGLALIDPAHVPAGDGATMSARSSVFLVDVDPASPERGTFRPVEGRLFTTTTHFVAANTLAVKPLAGFVLRPGTLYAAVVRRSFGDARGRPLGTSRDLELLKNTTPRSDAAEDAARKLHAPVFDQLAELGAAREDIAAIAVFRTQTPETLTMKLLDATAHLAGDDRPRVVSAAWTAQPPSRGRATTYALVRGVYCTPNFQSDIAKAPFFESGGEIARGADGAPVVVRIPAESPYFAEACKGLVRARFFVSVPLTPMPPGGFPLMLVGHGTGGSAASFLGENDFAGWAAREGVAVVSTDQPIHGGDDPETARPGSREPAVLKLGTFSLPVGEGRTVNELGFYNPLRPAVARDNLRQAAVDGYALLHLLASTDLGPALTAAHASAGAPSSSVAPRFDATKLFYGGHSQGSQSAAVLGALDRGVLGVVLSGCGGDVRIGIARRKDLPVMPLLEGILGLESDELDEFHPLLALAQTLADPIDPQSYAHFYRERREGHVPSVLHFEGTADTYNPPAAAEALAVALRAAQVGRVVRPVPGLELIGTPRGVATAQANAASGATIGFLQYASTRNENGHFVLYYEPGAADVLRSFLRTAVAGDPVVQIARASP